MKELEKKIIGKWVDIKEKSRDIYALTEYFKIPASHLEQAVQKLSAAVEQGIVEYKQSILNLIFRSLGDIKYKSLNLDIFQELIDQAAVLLYIILIQRLITLGIFRLDKQKLEEKVSAENIEINLILKDVLARIKEDPAFTKQTAVKNILVQFSIYKNERQTLKKLSPNIKGNTNAFYENFKATFEKIFASIRRNYEVILQEEVAGFVKGNILSQLQDKHIASLLFSQVKEITRVFATLEYVHAEKYKTREILVKLYDSRNTVFILLEAELKFYKGFSQLKNGGDKMVTDICNSFSKEVVNIILKHLD